MQTLLQWFGKPTYVHSPQSPFQMRASLAKASNQASKLVHLDSMALMDTTIPFKFNTDLKLKNTPPFKHNGLLTTLNLAQI